MAALLYRLGRLTARRRWTTIVVWLVLLAVAVGGYLASGGRVASGFDIPGTPTQKVTDRLSETLPRFAGGSGSVVFSTRDGAELSTAQRDGISDAVRALRKVPGVRDVIDPFATERQRSDQVAKLEQSRQQIASGREQADAGVAQLDAAQTQLDAARAQLRAAVAAGAPSGTTAPALAQLDAQQGLLDQNRAALKASMAKLDAGQKQLDQGNALVSLSNGIRQVSKDGSAAIATVQFTKPRLELSEKTKQDVIDAVRAHPIDGVESDVSSEIAQGVPQILGIGEAVGVVIAAVVLIVMLGTLFAAALPIVTALVGVGVGVCASLSLSGVVEMTSVTPVLGVMLGLAVGIDYALFIVNRHRRQLAQGVELRESIALAAGTAGNAVVFAGTTVLVALLALNVVGIPFLGLMGTVGAICVAVAVLLSITATPALLSLVGERVLGRRGRARLERSIAGAGSGAGAGAAPDAGVARDGHDQTAATHPGHRVEHHSDHALPKAMRPMSTLRAVLTVVIGAAVLLTVAAPALSLRLGLPDGSSEPVGSTQYRAYSVLEKQFGAGANGPLLVTAEYADPVAKSDLTATELAIARRLDAAGDVAGVAPIATSDDRRLIAFQVLPRSGPLSPATEDLVRELRGIRGSGSSDSASGGAGIGDVRIGVAGQAAGNIDVSAKLASVLPIYLAVVVGLSLLILIVVFRSLAVPIIATGGFVLSLLATYGALTAVYQWGWLAPVFGVHDPGPLLNFLPVLLVGILFGLAMDYQLFLVSGMREAHAHGMPARRAVTWGVRQGRAVVTAAGIIMISVFGGFVFSDASLVRPIGLGLAFGVLLDAFVVRLLLVPAVMHLLGEWAWRIPRWLDRILPDVDIEGASLERDHETAFPADARG